MNTDQIVEEPSIIQPPLSPLKMSRENKKNAKKLKRKGVEKKNRKHLDNWNIARTATSELTNIIMTCANIVNICIQMPEDIRKQVDANFWNQVKTLDSDLIIFRDRIKTVAGQIPRDLLFVTEEDDFDYIAVMTTVDELNRDLHTTVIQTSGEISTILINLGIK